MYVYLHIYYVYINYIYLRIYYTYIFTLSLPLSCYLGSRGLIRFRFFFFFFFCMKTSLVVLCTSHYMPSGSTHCPVVSSLVVLWYCGITKDSYINVWSNAYRLPLSLSFKGSVSCWTFEWVNCFYLGFQNDDVVLFLLFLSIAILL